MEHKRLALIIRDIIDKNISLNHINPDHKIEDSFNSPESYKFGCLFVTAESGILLGIITDGDIRRTLQINQDLSKVLVEDVMSTRVIKISEDKSLVEAYRLMTEKNINHLPVVDSKERLVGFISLHDLAGYLSPEHLFIDLSEHSNLSENEQRHIHRYKFASNFIGPGSKVLDGACGSGYGSAILSGNNANVLGIDVNREVIKFANQRHLNKSVEFIVGDVATLSFPDASFDAVVSLETLEHLPNATCQKYLKNISSWLKPKGILVASSPMLRYKDCKPFITSPYHINELPKDELLAMFEICLPDFVFQFYYQDETRFVPLLDEHTGFCILVARKVK